MKAVMGVRFDLKTKAGSDTRKSREREGIII